LPHPLSGCNFGIRAEQRARGGRARPLYRFGGWWLTLAGKLSISSAIVGRKVQARSQNQDEDQGEYRMRCLYCRQKAGLLRRTCPVCARVIKIVEQTGGAVGLVGLVDIFTAQGLTREQVDRVLDAQVAGEPTLRDRMTSDLTNVLMRGLGMPGRQSPEDVRRVRRSMQASGGEGTWRVGEKPPGMP
jgi:hypothetical protein